MSYFVYWKHKITNLQQSLSYAQSSILLLFLEDSSECSSIGTQVEESSSVVDSIEQSVNGENYRLLTHTETTKVQSPTTQKNFKPILLPPKSPMRLFLPSLTQLDPGVLQLWPAPQKILQYKGTSYVPPLQLSFILRTTTDMESRKSI